MLRCIQTVSIAVALLICSCAIFVYDSDDTPDCDDDSLTIIIHHAPTLVGPN
jgi:hypothetical protein